jgi:hypothetical protein
LATIGELVLMVLSWSVWWFGEDPAVPAELGPMTVASAPKLVPYLWWQTLCAVSGQSRLGPPPESGVAPCAVPVDSPHRAAFCAPRGRIGRRRPDHGPGVLAAPAPPGARIGARALPRWIVRRGPGDRRRYRDGWA